MVMLNESLKKQETQFKAQCRAQLAELQALLACASAGATSKLDRLSELGWAGRRK